MSHLAFWSRNDLPEMRLSAERHHDILDTQVNSREYVMIIYLYFNVKKHLLCIQIVVPLAAIGL